MTRRFLCDRSKLKTPAVLFRGAHSAPKRVAFATGTEETIEASAHWNKKHWWKQVGQNGGFFYKILSDSVRRF